MNEATENKPINVRRAWGVEAHVLKARAPSAPVGKAANDTQLQAGAPGAVGEFIAPPTELAGLKALVSHSTILPQCIRAYKNNIAGFGIGVRYRDDVKETPEMKAEWDKITEVLELMNMDQPAKEVFADIVEARETYGIAYLEVMRNLAGEVVGIEAIRDVPSISKTSRLAPYVEVGYEYNGKAQARQKKFCKYRQQHIGKTVYFKEMGDPRAMDNRDGLYKEEVPLEHQANELLEFAIGQEAYGEVRWIGQVLGVDGNREAECLNNRYFKEGRHTPLMIMIKGGTLTEESFAKLQGYMDEIKGASGQHAFIVLEAENLEARTDMEGEKAPEIEIHSLAGMLQHDELFQDYLDNGRRKVQSAFQLPDLYVGYTTDFNRATAQSAQEITEKQVFQPERQNLTWAINNKLLADYRFRHVEAYFMAPEVSNPDDIMKILNVTERAGGLTPNKAKEITYKMFGETSENFDGEWGELPLAQARLLAPSGAPGLDLLQLSKADGTSGDEIAAVLKEIRALLKGAGE